MGYRTLADDEPAFAETTVDCPTCGRLTGADMLQPTELLPPAAVAALRNPRAPYFCDACRMRLLWLGLLEPVAYAEAHGATLEEQALLMDAILADPVAAGRDTMLAAWPMQTTDALTALTPVEDVAIELESVLRACDQPREEQ